MCGRRVGTSLEMFTTGRGHKLRLVHSGYFPCLNALPKFGLVLSYGLFAFSRCERTQ